MLLLVILWQMVAQGIFSNELDLARSGIASADWRTAAAALDRARIADPALYEANNLQYLRGRMAENLGDWSRAADEFDKIPLGSPLRPLAAWHAASAAIHLGSAPRAAAFAAELPPDFPADLKMKLASSASQELALTIYAQVNSREARFRRSAILNDIAALWGLLHERNSDDVVLECARQLAPLASTPRELLDVANAFLAQRAFDEALPLFERAGLDPAFAAEAHYQRARVFFLREDYKQAIAGYTTVAENFPRTDWQKDAEYQIASCYWRLGRYDDAAKAYAAYITRFGDRSDDGATRNLVDVYRVTGNSTKALAVIDRKLSVRVAAATRQALLLAKAKVLFSQKQFTAARDIFHQLGAMRLLNTPGGAGSDEVHYFEALAQFKLGNRTAAQTIWKTLTGDPLSYFGQKAAERLGAASPRIGAAQACAATADPAVKAATGRMSAITRPPRTTIDPLADPVADLVFMHLWDEAFILLDRARRPDARLAGDLAYLAGRYDRAIGYADRLADSDVSAWPFVYPAAYRQIICSAAAPDTADALWLHALIWQESKYDPAAESAASARGLMQFIPETERAVGARLGLQGLTPEQLYNPEMSIRLGARYWSELMSEFKYPELALAAYNGGPDNVRRWRAKLPDADVEFFVSDIGFSETKHYVQAVFSAHAAYLRNN